MPTFKCKMCGGSLTIEAGATVCECEYCGRKQTLPKLDDERRAGMFDRANHFRRNNEFDKASGIFEQILNEDSTDAEAYWSLVLCRYGIEYVEDPTTHKRLPTVNRSQYTSIFADENYKSALAYADAYQKTIYEAEAQAIDEIQKGILEISSKEEPFEVFISFKETGTDGRRTRDAVLAHELYNELTKEGFKTFFAPVTLESKLGQEYEPYIFAALNTAKVMVVVGTCRENFNAVWVKNEWSRFLALIKGGAKKTLIPAYRDMDPYDLPEEFSNLLAQDMGKLGFMQDLIRGIKKILSTDAQKPQVVHETKIINNNGSSVGNTNIEPLLKRVFLFLEDGDFKNADEYCERVLDLDPENGSAYVGKLMVDLQVNNISDISYAKYSFENNSNYIKAIRFLDEKARNDLSSQLNAVLERNEQQRIASIYSRAKDIFEKSHDEESLINAANLFASISEYKDAESKRRDCIIKADECKKDRIYFEAAKLAKTGSTENCEKAIEMLEKLRDWKKSEELRLYCKDIIQKNINEADYSNAVYLMKQNNLEGYETALTFLERIPGWKDADRRITFCNIRIQELNEKAEQEAKIAAEKEKQLQKLEKLKKLLILAVISLVLLTIGLLSIKSALTKKRYDTALNYYNAGEYEKAVIEFKKLEGYKDSDEILADCIFLINIQEQYQQAEDLYIEGQYEQAQLIFKTLTGYKDSEAQIVACETALKDIDYEQALELMQAEKYDEAISAFSALNGYKNSNSQISVCRAAINEKAYQQAVALFAAGKYEEAISAFTALNGYKDSNAQINACRTAINEKAYQQAVALFEAGKYEEAISAFTALGNYKDSATQITACQNGIKENSYQEACDLKNAGKYAEAYAIFCTLTGYKDVDDIIKNDKNISAAAAARKAYLAQFAIGKSVTFGAYEQDNNKSNGKEPIEWQVLANDGKKALLISKYALDAKEYNEDWEDVTWEKCTLRAWLNGDFYNTAFSTAEQAQIITTNVSADKNPEYSTDPGKATQDKIFLLSITEAEKYFSTDEARKCAPTAYAKANGVFTSDSFKTADGADICWWWLRSPGKRQSYADNVCSDGSVYNYGNIVTTDYGCVRPALWINLDS